MPMDFTNGKSTLVKVMTWCRQATKPLPAHCPLVDVSSNDHVDARWQYAGIGKRYIELWYQLVNIIRDDQYLATPSSSPGMQENNDAS